MAIDIDWVGIYEWYLGFSVSIPADGYSYDVTAILLYMCVIAHSSLWRSTIPQPQTLPTSK